MKNVILIGMPGCGKSTIGVVLAKVLGYRFIDGDLLIQEQEGKLLSEIIAERGNEGFLEIENQVNRDLQADRSVISPGGSVIYGKEAMEHYQEIGVVVYLKLGYEALCRCPGIREKFLQETGIITEILIFVYKSSDCDIIIT